jgi:hypothetical protein
MAGVLLRVRVYAAIWRWRVVHVDCVIWRAIWKTVNRYPAIVAGSVCRWRRCVYVLTRRIGWWWHVRGLLLSYLTRLKSTAKYPRRTKTSRFEWKVTKSSGIHQSLAKLNSSAVVEPQLELCHVIPSAYESNKSDLCIDLWLKWKPQPTLRFSLHLALDVVCTEDGLFNIQVLHAQKWHRKRLKRIIWILVHKDYLSSKQNCFYDIQVIAFVGLLEQPVKRRSNQKHLHSQSTRPIPPWIIEKYPAKEKKRIFLSSVLLKRRALISSP